MPPYLKLNLTLILLITIFSCKQSLPPERKAIDVVKASHALGGKFPVELTIENWLKDKRDEITFSGWNVNRKDDQTYLVSFAFKIYSWDKGSGEGGYFFLVNLDNKSIQNVTEKIKQETKPLSAPYKDEKEMSEKIIPKILQEEKFLSGKQLITNN